MFWSGIPLREEKGQEARAYGIADGEATPQVLVLRVQVRELGKPKFFFFHEHTREWEMLSKGRDTLDHELVDALRFEGICDGLGDENSQHDRPSISEGVRQLEHDHRQGNRRSGDARQSGCCANHRIQPWNHARPIRFARRKYGRGRPTPMRVLHRQSDDATGACADAEGRDEDPRGDFDAEGHDGESSLYDQRDCDHAHDGEGLRAGIERAEARVGIW